MKNATIGFILDRMAQGATLTSDELIRGISNVEDVPAETALQMVENASRAFGDWKASHDPRQQGFTSQTFQTTLPLTQTATG